MVSGMVRVSGMPLAAATKARAMPVLPLVGSTSSLPGPSRPSCSARQIMAAPMRHFTEKAGLRPSILASTRAPHPWVTRLSCTKGVLPMVRLLSA